MTEHEAVRSSTKAAPITLAELATHYRSVVDNLVEEINEILCETLAGEETYKKLEFNSELSAHVIAKAVMRFREVGYPVEIISGYKELEVKDKNACMTYNSGYGWLNVWYESLTDLVKSKGFKL